jgi:hypothetical protein
MRRFAIPSLLLLIACGPFFYQAPPGIGSYPERIAAKRWQHLFEEVTPIEAALPDIDGFDENRLLESLASLSVEKRHAAIDSLLAENRNSTYTANRANFLHELRELTADSALFAAANGYIQWRVQDIEDERNAALRNMATIRAEQRFTYLKEQIDKGDALLKPYLLVRRGALLFSEHGYALAETDFTAVIEEFPNHPRAEAAALMLARCHIERSRRLRWDENLKDRQRLTEELLEKADARLAEFIKAHPRGRFTPDALGWRGAIAFDRLQYGSAMKFQIERLDMQPTREITRTVLRECDMIFEKLLESPEAANADLWMDLGKFFDAAAVARHPLVSRLFVQHCIDPTANISLPMWWEENEYASQRTIDYLKRRIFIPKPFVKLALAELGKDLIKANPAPDATTLTLLAWSATDSGEHEQALALLDQIPAASLNDEALLAKGIVLQRIDRHPDALLAFDQLAAKFSASPLLADQPFRKTLSLQKTGQHGKAILEILPLAFPQSLASTETPRLHPRQQLIQWLDTLIQFTPLEELEIAFAGLPTPSTARDAVQSAIRTRALAAGRFDLAERHLSDQAAPLMPERYLPYDSLRIMLPMTRADWDARVAPLASLHAGLAANPDPSTKTKLHLAIARQWMEQRGFLTLPSLAICYYAASEGEKQELLRRKNAIELGFSRETIQHELDHRDEATPALRHALEAAKSTDPAIAAPALELANECLLRRAEFSLYQRSRALETEASRLSADLRAQLTGRFPDSVEAKRAVRFTFIPATGPWMPGDYNPENAVAALIDCIFGDAPEADSSTSIASEPLESPAAETTIEQVRKHLEAERIELNAMRAGSDPLAQYDIMNALIHLDDLTAAAALPGITTADYLNYATDKKEALPPAFKSLLDYNERIRPQINSQGYETGELTNDTIEGWREFLNAYPDSPKGEAASFRMTRLIARQSRGRPSITAYHFPAAPIPNGYKHVELSRGVSQNPNEVLAAITQHEKRFSNARYQDDLDLLRAGALIDLGEFPNALALLETILSNPVQRDLHAVAALEFADIAQRLLLTEQRASAAEAFRHTPGALPRLGNLVSGDTFLSRLQPLMPWLENR